jgi:hypothetical protein
MQACAGVCDLARAKLVSHGGAGPFQQCKCCTLLHCFFPCLSCNSLYIPYTCDQQVLRLVSDTHMHVYNAVLIPYTLAAPARSIQAAQTLTERVSQLLFSTLLHTHQHPHQLFTHPTCHRLGRAAHMTTTVKQLTVALLTRSTST